MRRRFAAKRPGLSIVAACALVLTQASGCGRGKASGSEAAPGLSGSGFSATSAGASASSSASAGDAADAGGDSVPEASGSAVVSLDGTATPPPEPAEDVPRLASAAMSTDVRSRPDKNAPKIGYLRAGAVVEMDPDPAGTSGCPGGWRRIKPGGFVCVGPEATLDLSNPIVRASRRRPDVTRTLPYMYGVVTRGGPAYARIPTEKDVREFEPGLKKHIAKWKKDKESGATYGLDLWLRWAKEPAPPAIEALEQGVTDKEIPWYLADHAAAPNLSGLIKSADASKIDSLSKRNGVAFLESFLFEGRRYNVSTDLRVMPADRFRPIRGSEFHGYLIGKDVDFPFALVRRKNAKQYSWDASKKRLVEAGDLPWRSAVGLTGKQKFWDGKLHYETKSGTWVDDRSAGRVDPAKKMPAWGKNGEKWIDVNITKQVLVAYEGTKAVFATLVSSGEAGLDDPETTKSTKRGIFRIHTKYISITMDSDVVGEEYELRDVPYVQYFEGGYALHGAYWHDGFGQPKSHGCINLAPDDARRLFWWTEPQVPPGWHGVAKPLTGTVVFVHP